MCVTRPCIRGNTKKNQILARIYLHLVRFKNKFCPCVRKYFTIFFYVIFLFLPVGHKNGRLACIFEKKNVSATTLTSTTFYGRRTVSMYG